MVDVIVYSGSHCPFCDRAKMLLKKKNVTFRDYDVRADQDKLAEMMAKSGGKKSVPQIFIGSLHVGGCDDLYALESAGKLDALLSS